MLFCFSVFFFFFVSFAKPEIWNFDCFYFSPPFSQQLEGSCLRVLVSCLLLVLWIDLVKSYGIAS